MASADQLKALVKSHISRDDNQFYSVAMQVAAHEAKAGHGKLAEELRDMIDAAKTRSISSEPGKLVPLARPRGELANLLDVSYPKNRLADMVLDPTVFEQLQRIMKEQRLHARIREHGLSPRRKILLVGPPGTGKTMTAAVLAGELGVPLFLVRLDSLITKFMGETAAKLRQVFDAVSDVRGVYFFDEFDAIGEQASVRRHVSHVDAGVATGVLEAANRVGGQGQGKFRRHLAARNRLERFGDALERLRQTLHRVVRAIERDHAHRDENHERYEESGLRERFADRQVQHQPHRDDQ